MSKYPRTLHLPFSPGISSDDKVQHDLSGILNKKVYILEKMDGSNVCLERDNLFARSHNSLPKHPSFDALKPIWNTIRYNIPENWQIFGEWLYAKHSIHYTKLPSYLMVFGIRESDTWLSWNDVCDYANSLGLQVVPELFTGEFKTEKELQKKIDELLQLGSWYGNEMEGCVVRDVQAFDNENFPTCVCKWVRVGHVQTTQHWTNQAITKNLLI